MEIRGIEAVARCAAVDKREELLYTGLDNGAVVIYDISTGEAVSRLKAKEQTTRINSLIIGDLGYVIYVSDIRGRIFVWEVDTPLLLNTIELENDLIHNMVFDEEKNLIYIATDSGDIGVLDCKSNDMENSFLGDESAVNKLVVVPGRGLVLGSTEDGKILVWDRDTRQLIKNLRSFKLDGLRGIAVSDNEADLYAIGANNIIEYWDMEEGTLRSRESVEEPKKRNQKTRYW